MALAIETRLVTAAELLARSDECGRCELIAGEVVTMPPAGERHAALCALITCHLWLWSRAGGGGRVLESSGGFLLSTQPDTVRAPDVAWLSPRRSAAAAAAGYPLGAPDLAVEVASPSDTTTAVHDKASMWLAHGAQVVWVVWPAQQTVWNWSRDAGRVVLRNDATLTSPLLPGFALPLAELFAE
ncbi:MAG: Uma2 family endonuclease [Fimbriimonadaceae bacterium]|nr:Uma2 family endonuclease [Fimbriimonadaceae bacterium]